VNRRPHLKHSAHKRVLVLLLTSLLLLCACGRGRSRSTETAYVAAAQANLRDRLAQMYNKVGVLKNGEQVEILEKQRRFARVRTESGMEGWVEQRSLVGQEVFEAVQKLARESKDTPSQAVGITRAELNQHIAPGRQTEHLYQIGEGEKIDLLKRTVIEKPGSGAPAVKATGLGTQDAPKPVLEDWWLVRNRAGRTGWVLGRMVDVDLPMEVAQYAEGQRIVAFFILNKVKDEDKIVPQYLTLVTEPKDGLPWDFNQIRLFTWNARRDRYETAYRERNIFGLLPVRTGFENFEKEGALPFFVIRVQDDSGNTFEKKYKLNGPIVRRVLSPEEQRSASESRPRRRR
jgi:SH3-like domain-containing protein